MADASESLGTSGEPTDESAAAAFAIGDVVHDTDDDDPNDAIVVNLPSKTATDWIAYRDTTVAEDNPDHSADASVIVVCFAHKLQEEFPDWEGESYLPLKSINGSNIMHYSFPAPRLTVIESTDSDGESASSDGESADADSGSVEESSAPASEDEESDTALDSESDGDAPESDDAPATEADLSDPMCALKDRLEEGGMSVEIEPDGEALSVSKLGDSYQVRPGAVIEGDGALQGRLSSIVSEYG
jgi:hypothetical protein